jgi:hypothetical protein
MVTFRFTPGGVFDRFTFFGLLMPGLFTLAVVAPLAPKQLLTVDPVVAVLVLVSLGFVLGAVVNTVSGLVAPKTPVLVEPARVFHELLTADWFLVDHRPLNPVERRLFDRLFGYFRATGVVRRTRRRTLDESETALLYRHVLSECWRHDGSLTRLHQSVRLAARSLTVVGTAVAVTAAGLWLWRRLPTTVPFESAYTVVVEVDAQFFLPYLGFLLLVVVSAAYRERRSAGYLVFYAVVEFLDRRGDRPREPSSLRTGRAER